jgi:hypothetical protein
METRSNSFFHFVVVFESRVPDARLQGCPIARAAHAEEVNMITRNNLWSALIVIAAAFIIAASSTQAQTRRRTARVSGPPTLSLSAEPNVLRVCEGEPASVRLFANASSGSGAALRYRWTVDAGRLSGSGANAAWDLAGARPGTYHAVADVDEGDENCAAFASVTIVVTECPPPPPPPPPSCPTVTVSCPDSATENAPVTFSANVSGGSSNVTPTYNWTVSAGRIMSGQGTTSITVDPAGLAGQTIRATLDVGGYGMPCPASCTVSIPIEEKSRKFDEYYDIARNDEKARLDNYAIELQGAPGSQGYIIVYPSQKAKAGDAQARATRISDYLINSRGIDASRFTVTVGKAREGWLTELWIVPQGAPPPVPQR